LSEVERQILFDAILFHKEKKYDLIAAVVMPDHFHLLLKPLPKGAGYYSLNEIFHSIKSFSAQQIRKHRVGGSIQSDRVGGSILAASSAIPDISQAKSKAGSKDAASHAFRVGNPIKIFQDENYDHIIRNEKDYREKLWYIIMNPVEAGLCARAEDYPYLYCAEIGKH
jgi:putative transposase